ncbi:MAG TPA: hypothetical protein VMU99_05185 [Acidimicrobiales bacterium]|nr:hypothetical protein [Acidimicrobiales bacterium]
MRDHFFLDLAPTFSPPTLTRLIAAAVLSVVTSLGADDLIIRATTALYPSTRGFSHFRVIDYASLTIIGIATASAAWPAAINVSSSPRRLFFRLAIVATILLWIPDGWLLLRHAPPKAVGSLMVMHLAVASITYNTLTRIAVPRQLVSGAAVDLDQSTAISKSQTNDLSTPHASERVPRSTTRRSMWILLLSASCVEFVIGIAALIFVPYGRQNAWIPARGEIVYLAHAILGGFLTIGAFGILLPALSESRIARIGSTIGCSGVTLGAAGGTLAVFHSSRLIGMALMLVGVVLAFFGYLTPIIEPSKPPNEHQ